MVTPCGVFEKHGTLFLCPKVLYFTIPGDGATMSQYSSSPLDNDESSNIANLLSVSLDGFLFVIPVDGIVDVKIVSLF